MIAIVDDDAGVSLALVRTLSVHGFTVKAFPSADALLQSGQLSSATCLLLDLQMPGKNGLDLQTTLNAEGHRIPIIFMTGLLDEKTRDLALKSGAVDILEKPFDNKVLVHKIKTAMLRFSRTPNPKTK